MKKNTEAESLFIISNPRSGSTQLVQYVRQVPGCVCFGEIFKRDTMSKELRTKVRDHETAESLFATDSRGFWEHARTHRKGKPRIVGAKLFPRHRRGDPIWDLVFSGTPRVIHLWRNRIFDTHISSLRSQTSGQWQLKKDQQPDTQDTSRPIRFDADKYLRYRKSARREFEWVTSRLADNPKALSVEYAEIADPAKLSLRFSEYFGVPVTLETTLQKMTTRPALSYVENPEEAAPFVDDLLNQPDPDR
ncbi:MAG: sulfotransferase [Rhodobacteraceae bacterium HLUCCA12]|nr:MAG: sulfotransferase [Rhodobacteraceae bacterium HLUCCA12]